MDVIEHLLRPRQWQQQVLEDAQQVQMVVLELAKSIELVNVAVQIKQLLRERREMSTNDCAGGLSVNSWSSF